jgi:hypothetical protein
MEIRGQRRYDRTKNERTEFTANHREKVKYICEADENDVLVLFNQETWCRASIVFSCGTGPNKTIPFQAGQRSNHHSQVPDDVADTTWFSLQSTPMSASGSSNLERATMSLL